MLPGGTQTPLDTTQLKINLSFQFWIHLVVNQPNERAPWMRAALLDLNQTLQMSIDFLMTRLSGGQYSSKHCCFVLSSYVIAGVIQLTKQRITYVNKGRNDNLPRICLTEMEGDSTSCKVNRAGVNFLVRFTSLS